MKHFILLAVFAALVSCDFEFDPMGSNNPDNPCIWYPEMISDEDTLSVPCTVTFELLLSKRDSVLEFLQLTAEKKKRKNKERVINLNLIC